MDRVSIGSGWSRSWGPTETRYEVLHRRPSVSESGVDTRLHVEPRCCRAAVCGSLRLQVRDGTAPVTTRKSGKVSFALRRLYFANGPRLAERRHNLSEIATHFFKVLCARIFNMAAAFARAAPSPLPPTRSNRQQSAETRVASPCHPRRSACPRVIAIVRSGPPRSCSTPPPCPSRTKSRARRSLRELLKNGHLNSLRSPQGARTILQENGR